MLGRRVALFTALSLGGLLLPTTAQAWTSFGSSSISVLTGTRYAVSEPTGNGSTLRADASAALELIGPLSRADAADRAADPGRPELHQTLDGLQEELDAGVSGAAVAEVQGPVVGLVAGPGVDAAVVVYADGETVSAPLVSPLRAIRVGRRAAGGTGARRAVRVAVLDRPSGVPVGIRLLARDGSTLLRDALRPDGALLASPHTILRRRGALRVNVAPIAELAPPVPGVPDRVERGEQVTRVNAGVRTVSRSMGPAALRPRADVRFEDALGAVLVSGSVAPTVGGLRLRTRTGRTLRIRARSVPLGTGRTFARLLPRGFRPVELTVLSRAGLPLRRRRVTRTTGSIRVFAALPASTIVGPVVPADAFAGDDREGDGDPALALASAAGQSCVVLARSREVVHCDSPPVDAESVRFAIETLGDPRVLDADETLLALLPPEAAKVRLSSAQLGGRRISGTVVPVVRLADGTGLLAARVRGADLLAGGRGLEAMLLDAGGRVLARYRDVYAEAEDG